MVGLPSQSFVLPIAQATYISGLNHRQKVRGTIVLSDMIYMIWEDRRGTAAICLEWKKKISIASSH